MGFLQGFAALLAVLVVVALVLGVATMFYAAIIALALNVAHIFGWLWW